MILLFRISALFLKEFYNKLKATFTPGLENVDFAPEINAGNFIKEAEVCMNQKVQTIHSRFYVRYYTQ